MKKFQKALILAFEVILLNWNFFPRFSSLCNRFFLAGACCSRVRVTFVRQYYNTGAHALLKNRIYKDFRKQWGNFNGSPYYRNGNYGIWYCGRGWYIGEIGYRGKCSGLAANNIHSQCPPRPSNRNWIYRNRGTWQNAGQSLVIICSS